MNQSMQIRLLIGLIAIVAVGLFAGVLPRVHSIKRLKAESLSLLDRAHRADNGAAELTRLRNRLDELRADAETRVKDIPADSDVSGLVRAMTTRLDQLGMPEREITTGATNDLGDALSAPMSVRIKGPFLKTLAAVEWIESMPRLVRILRLKIQFPARGPAPSEDGDSPAIESELLMNVYFDLDRLAGKATQAAVTEASR